MNAIRIAFVDDHPTLLRGIAALFSSDDGRYDIVGTGSSATDAVALAAEHAPDILTLDLSMPGDALVAIRTIVEHGPTKVIVFTAFANVELALKALDAGAHAFVLKGRPSEDLYAAMDSVMAGELFVSPDFSQKLMAAFRNRTKREKELQSARLSAREQQLVECLFEAKTNKEIARTLQLSEKTVKHYMTNLMNKLKVKNRLEVVLAAQALRDHGMIERMPEGRE